MVIKVAHMRQELADSRLEYKHQLIVIRGELMRINKNIIRSINRPAHSVKIQHNSQESNQQHNNPETLAVGIVVNSAPAPSVFDVEMEELPTEPHVVAVLSRCPRSLHDLWSKYAFGSTGVKAAKDFTNKERGTMK